MAGVQRLWQAFARLEAAGCIVLLTCTAISLALANSAWAGTYAGLWQTRVVVGVGGWALDKPLLLWVNEALMALFFFVVGLEIKRELLAGELAGARRATLPVAAALGGMLVPAGIYAAFNAGTRGAPGWGIPMATDIAFALGVIALVGRRLPLALKVFLAALAIADDIGAVLVIALFYTEAVHWPALAVSAGFLLSLIAANWAGVRHPLAYGLLGLAVWLAFLKSGIHATVAGVVVAAAIPARGQLDPRAVIARTEAILATFARASAGEAPPLANAQRRAALQELEITCQHVETPLQHLEHVLHPWVAFVVVPLFALGNAGVAWGEGAVMSLGQPVALGIIAGLVAGKPLGIVLFSWLAVRSGLAALPEGVTWRQLWGASSLAGIGFTMSVFIADLAFGGDPLLAVAKRAIIIASLLAGLCGWLLLRTCQRPPDLQL
jgi:NhaA family Na+:H+ antiporter